MIKLHVALFFEAEINSTIIKHRCHNAVNVSVRHTAFFVNKNTLVNTSQNLIGNITLKSHTGFVVSTMVAPTLLSASKLSFDEFILFGTPRHSPTLNTCSSHDLSYLCKAFDFTCDQCAHEFASHQLNFDADELHMTLKQCAVFLSRTSIAHSLSGRILFNVKLTRQQNFHNETVFYLGRV